MCKQHLLPQPSTPTLEDPILMRALSEASLMRATCIKMRGRDHSQVTSSAGKGAQLSRISPNRVSGVIVRVI
eukprot:6204103-Pleurochrysis_carterae.AAC.1